MEADFLFWRWEHIEISFNEVYAATYSPQVLQNVLDERIESVKDCDKGELCSKDFLCIVYDEFFRAGAVL